MAQRKPINPFYVALLPFGVAFAITACAYLVMSMRVLDPRRGDDSALIGLLERHGTTVMAIELVVLGILTVAAIASDDFWMRRHEASSERNSNRGETP
jgi:hypothetical protein